MNQKDLRDLSAPAEDPTISERKLSIAKRSCLTSGLVRHESNYGWRWDRVGIVFGLARVLRFAL
jgi:hypothetical protein